MIGMVLSPRTSILIIVLLNYLIMSTAWFFATGDLQQAVLVSLLVTFLQSFVPLFFITYLNRVLYLTMSTDTFAEHAVKNMRKEMDDRTDDP